MTLGGLVVIVVVVVVVVVMSYATFSSHFECLHIVHVFQYSTDCRGMAT